MISNKKINTEVLFVAAYLESDKTSNYTMPFIDRQFESLKNENLKIRPFSLKIHKTKLNYFRSIKLITNIVRKHKISIIHAHYLYVAIPCIFCKDTRVVLSLMGTDVLGDVGKGFKIKLKNVFSKILAYLILPKCDAIIVKSKEMEQMVFHNNIHVIPNGVDFTKFRPISKIEAKKRLNLNTKSKIILFAGDPERTRKNYKLALQVHKLLSKKYNDTLLLPLKDIPHNDIPIYLNSATCLLVTSFNEGSPNIVKEALACDTPVVSVDVGDISERVIGLELCAVCGFDAVQLSKKVANIFESEKRPVYRDKVQYLDQKYIAKKIIDLYDELLP